MSKTIGIISSEIVTEERLTSFVKDHGGIYTGDLGLFARFSKEDSHIWIGCGSFKELERDIEEDRNVLIEKLGGIPRTEVIVELGDGKDSGMLALSFALLFTNHWPAVVDNLRDHLFSRDELVRFCEIGNSFGISLGSSYVDPAKGIIR